MRRVLFGGLGSFVHSSRKPERREKGKKKRKVSRPKRQENTSAKKKIFPSVWVLNSFLITSVPSANRPLPTRPPSSLQTPTSFPYPPHLPFSRSACPRPPPPAASPLSRLLPLHSSQRSSLSPWVPALLLSRAHGPSSSFVPSSQFNRAVSVIQSLPKTGPIQSSYEEKLAMYSLFKQGQSSWGGS